VLVRVARAQRVCVLASVASLPVALPHADRVLVLADGGLVWDGAPSAMPTQAVAGLAR
jgi:ABC-type phosphate/phosphonate transport system ATPase subunit